MPTAVLRRYTPPTCTLEIAATGSALSRWTDRTVLKNLNFQLSFDDPKLLPDQQVTVSGNHNQLEALCEVVTSYVQSFLVTPVSQVQWEEALQGMTELPPNAQTNAQTAAPVLMSAEPMGISLQPKGLLSHDLKLGSLATEESGAVVRLTALQLFDLANALESYRTEALSLPMTGRPAWLNPPKWASVAAVAVLALGATGAIAKFVLDIATPTVQTASAPQEREVNSELNSDLFPRLSPPELEPSPSMTLQPLPPPPLPNGAAADQAGLPPVGVTKAPPNAAPQPAVPLPPDGTAGSAQPQTVIIPNPESNSVAAVPSESAASAARSANGAPNSAPPRLESTAPEAATLGAADLPTDSTTAANSSTAFDTIPQVAEIRSYFQQRWQPSEGLTNTLEYRLLLNADGSLQRIVPLGQASANYLDRTNMPLMGEQFVSPTEDGSTPQIRLVLKPNGQVQTFLEYAN